MTEKFSQNWPILVVDTQVYNCEIFYCGIFFEFLVSQIFQKHKYLFDFLLHSRNQKNDKVDHIFRTVCCRFCSTYSCIECYLACSCQGVFCHYHRYRFENDKIDGLLIRRSTLGYIYNTYVTLEPTQGRKLRDSNRKDGGRRTKLEECEKQYGTSFDDDGYRCKTRRVNSQSRTLRLLDWARPSTLWTVTISRHPYYCNSFLRILTTLRSV